MYLDSLDVDEPVPSAEDCPIRAEAWDDKLIQAVVRKDTKSNGEFGKLRVIITTFNSMRQLWPHGTINLHFFFYSSKMVSG